MFGRVWVHFLFDQGTKQVGLPVFGHKVLIFTEAAIWGTMIFLREQWRHSGFVGQELVLSLTLAVGCLRHFSGVFVLSSSPGGVGVGGQLWGLQQGAGSLSYTLFSQLLFHFI